MSLPQNNSENTLVLEKSFFENFLSFVRDLIIILMIFVIIGTFFVIPFRIIGDSMEKNYHSGEFILVNKFSYLNLSTHFADWKGENNFFAKRFIANIFEKIPLHIGDPGRGDVVVVRPHVSNERQFYLKRVIALPGETIRIIGGEVFIKKNENSDFVKISEDYLSDENNRKTYLPYDAMANDFTLPEGKYWVMGDNRLFSADSRNCFFSCDTENATHFMDRADIVGKMWISFGYFELFNEKFFDWKVRSRFFDTPASYIYSELE